MRTSSRLLFFSLLKRAAQGMTRSPSFCRFAGILFCLSFAAIPGGVAGSLWKVEDGWAMRSQDGGNTYEKFFAIGIFNPGYYAYNNFSNEGNADGTGCCPDFCPENERTWTDAAALFNLMYSPYDLPYPYTSGCDPFADCTGDSCLKEYMNQTVLMTGQSHLTYRFTKKGDATPMDPPPAFHNADDTLDYSDMYSLQHWDSQWFDQYFDQHVAGDLQGNMASRNLDFIWWIIDEAGQGGVPTTATPKVNWYWHPDLLKRYNDAAHAVDPGALTYLNVGGHLNGSEYFYELNYRNLPPPREQNQGEMPAILPVGACSGMAWNDPATSDPPDLECFPNSPDGKGWESDPDAVEVRYPGWGIRAFRTSAPTPWDCGPGMTCWSPGVPFFEYKKDSNGKWNWTFNTIEATEYENNVVRAANAFCPAADVIGWDAYLEFQGHPALAGQVVDWIKEACGTQKPVWHILEGAGGTYIPGGFHPTCQTTPPDPSDPDGIFCCPPNHYSSKNEYYQCCSGDPAWPMERTKQLIRAQAYTSIVHGATGVLFFGRRACVNFYDEIKEIAHDLKVHSFIFKGTKIGTTQMDGSVHWAEWETGSGTRYTVLVNAGYEAVSFPLSVRSIPNDIVLPIALNPFEVRIWAHK